VLDGFLRRDRIFLTDEMAHLEGPARANLSAELMSLSVPMDPVAAAAYLA
jgi:predicted metal-dependent HD superfamily phosphohydrolase